MSSENANNTPKVMVLHLDLGEEGSNSPQKKKLWVEGPPPDNHDNLTWRADPSQTFSDWTLKVVCKSSGVERTHCVHKHILACGRRKSLYFANLFQSAKEFRMKEAIHCTSRIELDPLAAAAVPQMLDYLYSETQPLEVTTESATALYFLGEYFDIWPLRWDAKQFIEQDLSVESLMTYYDHAKEFRSEEVMGIVASFIANNIHKFSSEHEITRRPDPDLWLTVLELIDSSEPNMTMKASEKVAVFCQNNLKCLDSQTFQRLTDGTKLPVVAAVASLALCEIEEALMTSTEEKALEKSPSKAGGEYSDFQKRCTTSIAKRWEALESHLQSRSFVKRLQKRNKNFLVDLLVKVTTEAHQDFHFCKKVVTQRKRKLKEARNPIRNPILRTAEP